MSLGQATRRDHYLEALGLEQWTRRSLPKAATTAATATATAATAAAAATATTAVPAAIAAAESVVTAMLPVPDASVPGDVHARWEELAAEVRSCVQCGLHAQRTQTVFGVGNRSAELLVVGEAPGADEDRQGGPFVGRAGQLLNAMLRALGAPRERVFIANVLKCRPPGNRDPNPEEVRCCLPFLHRQIALLQPRLMLAVGRIAAQNLLATETPIGKLRGSVHRFGPGGTPLIVTYHPAYLLRSPGEKRKAWSDLRFVRDELTRLRSAAAGGH